MTFACSSASWWVSAGTPVGASGGIAPDATCAAWTGSTSGAAAMAFDWPHAKMAAVNMVAPVRLTGMIEDWIFIMGGLIMMPPKAR